MRILYVAPFVPWRVRVRSNNIVTALTRNHDVAVVCMAGSDDEESHTEALRSLCRQVVCVRHSKTRAALQCALCLPTAIPLRLAYAFSPSMRDATRRMIADFAPDVLYVDRWRALPNVPVDHEVPIVCDPTDSMLLYNQRLIRAGAWWERLLGLEEAVKFNWYERRLSRRASRVVFCSRTDLQVAAGGRPSPNFGVLPNGVDCKKFSFKTQHIEEEPNRLVFTGNFGYRPNRHSVRFFLDRVYPLIKAQIHCVRLTLVGNEVERLGKLLEKETGVEAVGFVPDLRPYIARAAVSVVPITVGAGVPNKILEAFATGTAVVATPMACGDLPVRHGEHALLSEEPRDFAAAVVHLIQEPPLRARLALNARRLVQQDYDLDAVSKKLEHVLIDALRTRSGTAKTFAESSQPGDSTLHDIAIQGAQIRGER